MREQLFRAAYASDDDAERLVLADWLEQNGELARAQVIHLQCELARTGPYDRRRHELLWALDAALADLGDRWTSDLPRLDGVTWIALDRGLPSAVRVRDARTLATHHETIVASAPTVTRVVLDAMQTSDFADDLPWLRTLRIENAVYPSPLVSMPAALELDGDDDLDTIPRSGPLTSLAISGNSMHGDELAALVGSAAWAKDLRVLRMPTTRAEGSTGYYDQDPRMTSSGAASLVTLKTLEVLQIDRHLPGTKAVERMLALPKLRDFSGRSIGVKKLAMPSKGEAYIALDLSENPVGSAVVHAIAKSPRMSGLQQLVLDTCEIDSIGLAALVASPAWHSLRILDVSRNPLGRSGARTLCDAAPPAELHTLHIADADLDDGCGALLAKTRWLGQLLELDLTGNRLGRGLADLRELDLASLRKLSLMSVGMGRTEAALLSKLWPELVHLAIGDNAIGDAGIERFALTKEAAHLQSLALWKCNLTDDGLELLARARCPRLRVLQLWGNRVTGPGIAQLLAAPIMRDVTALDLRHCELDARSIETLAMTAMPPALRTLDLRANELTEASLRVLAESQTLHAVANVKLDGNPFTFDARVREQLAARFGASWYQ